MGEASLEACAGFLVGRASACPLLGRAMSKGGSRGSCGLRKSLGNLSADAWRCVPTQLVVWPEPSWH